MPVLNPEECPLLARLIEERGVSMDDYHNHAGTIEDNLIRAYRMVGIREDKQYSVVHLFCGEQIKRLAQVKADYELTDEDTELFVKLKDMEWQHYYGGKCQNCNGEGKTYQDGIEFPRTCKVCGGTGKSRN